MSLEDTNEFSWNRSTNGSVCTLSHVLQSLKVTRQGNGTPHC